MHSLPVSLARFFIEVVAEKPLGCTIRSEWGGPGSFLSIRGRSPFHRVVIE